MAGRNNRAGKGGKGQREKGKEAVGGADNAIPGFGGGKLRAFFDDTYYHATEKKGGEMLHVLYATRKDGYWAHVTEESKEFGGEFMLRIGKKGNGVNNVATTGEFFDETVNPSAINATIQRMINKDKQERAQQASRNR